MDTLNAKRLTAGQVASTFVVPASFERIGGQDHVYVIGPRGSGKTTLLRMLTGESLMAWSGPDADVARQRIRFSSIFVPADELWASQTSLVDTRAAFTAQLLLSLVDTMIYRTAGDGAVHLPALLKPAEEGALARHCATLWGLRNVTGGFLGLQSALEIFLGTLPRTDVGSHPLSGEDGLRLMVAGLTAFNRVTSQRNHRWALLLDEMELAPAEVHRLVTSFVRGGPPVLTLKISMSPFNRFMEFYGDQAKPAPGHDFQTIYLSGQEPRELRRLTNGLWDEALRARNLPPKPLPAALSEFSRSQRNARAPERLDVRLVSELSRRDASLSEWLARRGVNAQDTSGMSYEQRSATIRKILPLLVYRDALLNFRDGRPVQRSRKKSFEPFTGPHAVVTMLEGNPRWIKSAFAQMLDYYDARTGSVSRGFQYDALTTVASRFESLLRVLPTRQGTAGAVPTIDLVDDIARYLHARNLGAFSADAPNSFTVDRRIPPEVEHALLLGLYAGAFVHIRDRRSPAVLSSFEGQRFRLTYLLAIRDGKELPLRLGKDVGLSTILRPRQRRGTASELPIDWSSYEGE